MTAVATMATTAACGGGDSGPADDGDDEAGDDEAVDAAPDAPGVTPCPGPDLDEDGLGFECDEHETIILPGSGANGFGDAAWQRYADGLFVGVFQVRCDLAPCTPAQMLVASSPSVSLALDPASTPWLDATDLSGLSRTAAGDILVSKVDDGVGSAAWLDLATGDLEPIDLAGTFAPGSHVFDGETTLLFNVRAGGLYRLYELARGAAPRLIATGASTTDNFVDFGGERPKVIGGAQPVAWVPVGSYGDKRFARYTAGAAGLDPGPAAALGPWTEVHYYFRTASTVYYTGSGPDGLELVALSADTAIALPLAASPAFVAATSSAIVIGEPDGAGGLAVSLIGPNGVELVGTAAADAYRNTTLLVAPDPAAGEVLIVRPDGSHAGAGPGLAAIDWDLADTTAVVTSLEYDGDTAVHRYRRYTLDGEDGGIVAAMVGAVAAPDVHVAHDGSALIVEPATGQLLAIPPGTTTPIVLGPAPATLQCGRGVDVTVCIADGRLVSYRGGVLDDEGPSPADGIETASVSDHHLTETHYDTGYVVLHHADNRALAHPVVALDGSVTVLEIETNPDPVARDLDGNVLAVADPADLMRLTGADAERIVVGLRALYPERGPKRWAHGRDGVGSYLRPFDLAACCWIAEGEYVPAVSDEPDTSRLESVFVDRGSFVVFTILDPDHEPDRAAP